MSSVPAEGGAGAGAGGVCGGAALVGGAYADWSSCAQRLAWRRETRLLTAVAVPATTMLAAPAHAVDKSKRCDGARMELSVEKDDGKFEVDRDRRNTPGKDVFKMRVNKVGTGGSCSLTITRR